MYYNFNMEILNATTTSFALFLLLATTNALKILGIVPLPAFSHFYHVDAIMTTLHDAGHHITFVNAFPQKERTDNYTNIDSRGERSESLVNKFSIDFWKDMTYKDVLKFSIGLHETGCYDVMKLPEIQNILKSAKKLYDVMFIEMFFVTECFMPLAEKLGIPVIGILSQWSWTSSDYEIGNPRNPAAIPYEMSGFTEDLSSFRARLTSVWNYVYALWFHYTYDVPTLEKFYQRYYPNSQLIRKNKISLLFLWSHSSFFPRPLAPNVVEIGGVDIKPTKVLPENIKAFVEDSKNGVILFSLGSALRGSDISPEMTNVIVDAFSEIPQRVIWKFEEKIDDLPKNVLISNWIPQRDILAHANVIAFMSHCGMTGMFEAIYTATPMVLMPVFGDQPTNAAILKKLGVGVYLDIFSITKAKLLAALNEVINNTKYRENMRELSQKFRDRPMTPQQSVVYWTEYVARHNGASHLRTVAADMPLYQYLLVDVVTFAGIMTTAVVFGFYYIIKKVCTLRRLIKGPPKLEKKNL